VATRRISHDVISDINITPFTDVVLVLLIIFLISTPLFMMEGLRTDLPALNRQSQTASQKPTFITISITATGSVTLNDKPCPIHQLTPLLTEMIKSNPESILKIGADDETLYDIIVKVIDSARAAGIERYVLVQ
jgi:biopolymer transport protein TolR